MRQEHVKTMGSGADHFSVRHCGHSLFLLRVKPGTPIFTTLELLADRVSILSTCVSIVSSFNPFYFPKKRIQMIL